MSELFLFKHVPVCPQLFHRSSMEPLLAILNGLSPPQLVIIVRSAIELLTAEEKAALWIALAPSGMVQVMDLDQKTSPQSGVKRGRPPKAEVCQELIYQSVRFVMWFGMLLLVTSCSRLFELRKNHTFVCKCPLTGLREQQEQHAMEDHDERPDVAIRNSAVWKPLSRLFVGRPEA